MRLLHYEERAAPKYGKCFVKLLFGYFGDWFWITRETDIVHYDVYAAELRDRLAEETADIRERLDFKWSSSR